MVMLKEMLKDCGSKLLLFIVTDMREEVACSSLVDRAC